MKLNITKQFIYFILKIATVTFLFYLIFSSVDTKESFLVLRDIKLAYFFTGLFILFICWIVSSKKWKILLEYLGFTISLTKLLELNLVSNFYSIVLPGGKFTGEAIKCYRIIKKILKKKN